MKQQSKLSQKPELVTDQQIQTDAVREFATADELLRTDAAQTAVPPEIGERLKQSAATIAPPAAQPWWKKLLGR